MCSVVLPESRNGKLDYTRKRPPETIRMWNVKERRIVNDGTVTASAHIHIHTHSHLYRMHNRSMFVVCLSCRLWTCWVILVLFYKFFFFYILFFKFFSPLSSIHWYTNVPTSSGNGQRRESTQHSLESTVIAIYLLVAGCSLLIVRECVKS